MEEHAPTHSPVLPAALPRLDLESRGEGPRQVKPVVVTTSSLQAGLRTHTCPQCGINPTTGLVKRTWQYVPPWVFIGLAFNIIILLIMYMAGRRVVKGELSLCADCDAADKRARTVQGLSAVGLVAFPALLGIPLGAILGAEAGIFGACAGLVSGIVGMVVAHKRTKPDAIRCTMIDKKSGAVTLTASESFQRVLAAEAPDALFPG